LKTERVDINYGDSEKRTPLILASQGGREDIVQVLLKYPLIEINSLDLLGETAFIKAVYWAWKDCQAIAAYSINGYQLCGFKEENATDASM